MRRIVFIDDEELVLQWEKEAFDWEKYGIEPCGDALDGQEGLQLIKELHPDIVITDIRMPVIDGLEIMKNTREEGINCHFIILSGYDDFSYAQKALQYGAADYLLKPIDCEFPVVFPTRPFQE